MSSVDVKRVPEGYVVSRHFSSLPAAMRAVDQLLLVAEVAFDAAPITNDWENSPGFTRFKAYDAHPPLNLPRADEGS